MTVVAVIVAVVGLHMWHSRLEKRLRGMLQAPPATLPRLHQSPKGTYATGRPIGKRYRLRRRRTGPHVSDCMCCLVFLAASRPRRHHRPISEATFRPRGISVGTTHGTLASAGTEVTKRVFSWHLCLCYQRFYTRISHQHDVRCFS